tara:strand:- start:1031 stop:1219 length:189 start_codon:yes stop_codon:yes gene_type:complete
MSKVKEDINLVADWIVNDCHETIDEVRWLLKEIFINGDLIGTKESIRSVYDGVFEYKESEVE